MKQEKKRKRFGNNKKGVQYRNEYRCAITKN